MRAPKTAPSKNSSISFHDEASVKDILEFPVPNLKDEQLTNANIRLTALQSQLTALESLQRQSEDNARFILESYLGSMGSSEVVPEVEESKEHALSDSASPTNEIIHPEEPAVVASTESPVKKVVKRKKPVLAKPLGGAGLDVITHEE